jgi:hypothetical protein
MRTTHVFDGCSRGEPVEKVTKTVLEGLTSAPEGQLDPSLRDEVREFLLDEHTEEEARAFLTDLRNDCVHIGGASGFVMGLFAIVLDKEE